MFAVLSLVFCSEWPKVHFYIWPKLMAEYLKKFGLWLNTEAKTECWIFEDLILFLIINFW